MFLEDYGLAIEAKDELQDFNKKISISLPMSLKNTGAELDSDSFTIDLKLHGEGVILAHTADLSTLGHHVIAKLHGESVVIKTNDELTIDDMIDLIQRLVKSTEKKLVGAKSILCLLKTME